MALSAYKRHCHWLKLIPQWQLQAGSLDYVRCDLLLTSEDFY